MNRRSTERNTQQLRCAVEMLVTLRTYTDRQCSRAWPSVGTLGVLNQPGPPMNSGPSGVRPWFPFDGRDERDRESEGG